MATGLVLTVTQTLLSALQTKELRELCSLFGHESQLADLECTVETIKAVLLDAESKHQELNNQGLDWLNKLKDAVYDADDLFDEINTVAQQQKRLPGGKISKKVRRFFSGDNQLLFAASTSRKIKKLRKKLDSIAKDRTQFGISDVYVPVRRREETSSFVNELSIIGRDADKEVILNLLLPASDVVQENVSFVSIVGIGGLGKTALAQFVFQDDVIKSSFKLCMWVCVSEDFGLKEILFKMLGKNTELNIEELQKEVRQQIQGKKYFLVLDDVWEEDRNEWAKLREFLLLGAKGSKIIVTTRSKKVARAIGDYPMHELKGLSDEDSWCLFETIAFSLGSKQVEDAHIDIGKEVVKKCANVPLSIRVIGSMLYDQDESKWLLFQRIDLAKMGQGENGVMRILKFSYYHISPQLKTCFSYCALFPKDYVIKKELLINLWLAEGCLECPNDIRNIEDVGEEYFSILLHRCFFQDIEKDKYGEICSVKMHDLIHDLAQGVAGIESCLVMDSSTSLVNEKIRHVSVAFCHPLLPCPSDTFGKLRTLRTFLRPCFDDKVFWKSSVAIILENCRRLRVLDLHGLDIRALHNTLNNLLHLRYLDLSRNSNLVMLPKSIPKLHNLQVLNLKACYRLKELPEDLKELVNLRHLDITGCNALTHMPAGIGSMISLSTLPMFVLGGGGSKQVQIGQLRELMPLTNLRGALRIKFADGYSHDVTNAEEGSYLLNKKHIKDLVTTGAEGRYMKPVLVEPAILDERLLEGLQPHHDLKRIEIRGYKSIQLPGWAAAAALATTLPHLVRICLWHFQELRHLPQLSQLRHLKIVELGDMPNMEYMEDDNGAILFFPSLEELCLREFPKLKGWWREEVGVERQTVIPAFSRVHKLEIRNCPNLTSFPGIPLTKKLLLRKFNEALAFCTRRHKASPTPPIAPSSSTLSSGISKSSDIAYDNKSGDDAIYLDTLKIDHMGLLNSLFGESLGGIGSLEIMSSPESMSSVAGSYLRHASSIKELEFFNCCNIKSMSGGGIEHMTNLQHLRLVECPNLELEEEGDGMPWKALHKLIYLQLSDLPKVVNLPKGIQYLPSLETLYIERCNNLEALPEWLHNLTSLRKLSIGYCPKLMLLPEAISHIPSLIYLSIRGCDGLIERCLEPDGEDYRKIRHVLHLEVHCY